MNKNRLFLSMLWRSFFIQAIWNFERLQNIGFVYGLLPFFRYLYPDPGERREVLLRHIGFFNTHPYMVSMIFGMVASLEEDLRDGKPVNRDQLVTLKNNIAGPLAAIGDTFFWATWRPFTVLLGVSLILFFHSYNNVYGTWLA
ncbi:MAG: PTS system mannose/fructose/sorbose family transporter subunit IID, partial [Endomicrobiales bacterium]